MIHTIATALQLQRQQGGRVAYPADVLADVTFFEGDLQAALQYWQGERTRARADADPIRLVWTLYEVAICSSALGKPVPVLPAARDAVNIAESTGNPTARSWPTLRWATCSIERNQSATALCDAAAELAATMQNFFHSGTALMSAAATRALCGDPVVAAQMLIELLDQWDRVGRLIRAVDGAAVHRPVAGHARRQRRCRIPGARVRDGGYAVTQPGRSIACDGRPDGRWPSRRPPGRGRRRRHRGRERPLKPAQVRRTHSLIVGPNTDWLHKRIS